MVAQSIVDLQETFGAELIVRDLIPGFTVSSVILAHSLVLFLFRRF